MKTTIIDKKLQATFLFKEKYKIFQENTFKTRNFLLFLNNDRLSFKMAINFKEYFCKLIVRYLRPNGSNI